VCWRYERRDEFAVRAREFLAEGLAAGERVLYVGRDDVDTLTRQLCTTSVFDEGLRRGAVRVAALAATYPFEVVVEPEAQVRNYAAATEEALADGFTGLRVAADATPLVRTPAQLTAFTRYEYLVDRYMTTRPMSAMCAYSGAELDDEAIALLACLHPSASAGTAPFHLHAPTGDAVSAELDGALDLAARRLWPLALERADLRPVAGSVVIDATGLEFVDHRNLLALADYADLNRVPVVLRTRHSQPARILELMNVTSVRVEQV
jgi:anti-anti-sigma regulatory factor